MAVFEQASDGFVSTLFDRDCRHILTHLPAEPATLLTARTPAIQSHSGQALLKSIMKNCDWAIPAGTHMPRNQFFSMQA